MTYVPQVDKFEVQRPARVKGEVVGGGEVVVKLVWLNGPAEFMKNMTPKTQSQIYNSAELKAQYRIMKREKVA